MSKSKKGEEATSGVEIEQQSSISAISFVFTFTVKVAISGRNREFKLGLSRFYESRNKGRKRSLSEF